MHAKHLVLRAAAATIVTLFMTVGVVGPAGADPGNGKGAPQGAAMSQANSGGNSNSNGNAGSGQASNNGNGHGAGGAAASSSDDKGAAKRDADEAPVMAASTTESRSAGKSARAQEKTARGKSETRGTKRTVKASSSSRHNRPETGEKGVGPQPESKADQTDRGANAGDCDADRDVHPYCSTRDGSPSLNGNGKGKAKGKPCAGCVGKADNKYPKGQGPGPHRDGNRGYECDHNNGIGKSNPAHTGCTDSPDEPEKPEEPCKPGKCDSDGCPSWKDCDSHGCPPWKDCGDDSCVGGECPTDEDKCERGDKECREDTTPPPTTKECPDGDWNGMEEGCGTPPSPEVGPEFEDEVAGVEQERTGPPAFVEMERANRAPAEVAPSAGFLPDTGAGQLGLAALAGGLLLAAGGAVLAMRRPQAKR